MRVKRAGFANEPALHNSGETRGATYGHHKSPTNGLITGSSSREKIRASSRRLLQGEDYALVEITRRMACGRSVRVSKMGESKRFWGANNRRALPERFFPPKTK